MNLKRRRWALAGAAAAVAAAALPALATTGPSGGCSWPMYQHDASRTGAAGDCGSASITPGSVGGLRPQWFFSTQPAAVTASPTVAAGAVYVGDSNGAFHALDAGSSSPSGHQRWSFDVTKGYTDAKGVTSCKDAHTPSYGEITSSAAYWAGNGRPDSATVYFGGGGTVYALDATTGTPRWCFDADRRNPQSPMEVESSPLLYWPAADHQSPPEVIVGTDVNESTDQTATGVLALNGASGALEWKFDPETESVITDPSDPLNNAPHNGCGDVWSSPAYDASNGLIIFTTGNCSRPGGDASIKPKVATEAVWAVRAADGTYVWDLPQSAAPGSVTKCDQPYGGDDDFGASPVVATVGSEVVVVAASKAGCVYELDAANGRIIWQTQAAQPGQSGPQFAGALGGFIGSTALGGGVLFASSAIPLPFQGAGPDPTDPQNALPLDPTIASNPKRASSLHAIDVSSGAVRWDQPLATASYAPVTYANGVVFAPSTTSFAVEAFSAADGHPLWAFPTGGAMSSGAAVVGDQVFLGSGTNENQSPALPPQNTGVWAFGLPAS